MRTPAVLAVRLALAAGTALAVGIGVVFRAQITWFPDGCVIGDPWPWLSGVGSSLEMNIGWHGLIANALSPTCWVAAPTIAIALLVPRRVSLRWLVLASAMVIVTSLWPVLTNPFNHHSWTVGGAGAADFPVQRCVFEAVLRARRQ